MWGLRESWCWYGVGKGGVSCVYGVGLSGRLGGFDKWGLLGSGIVIGWV